MSTQDQNAANVSSNNETATAKTVKTVKATTAKTRKPRAKKVTEEIKEIVSEVAPKAKKEAAPRISKIDKVQSEICKQFEISGEQFWKFMAKHKPGKMNINKFADALVQQAFFNREKLAEQLQG